MRYAIFLCENRDGLTSSTILVPEEGNELKIDFSLLDSFWIISGDTPEEAQEEAKKRLDTMGRLK